MHLNSVKKFTVFVFVALFLAACGGEDSAASGAKGAGAPGKGGLVSLEYLKHSTNKEIRDLSVNQHL